MSPSEKINAHTDVILVWWWIMSATLGIFLKHLEPDLGIHIFERRDSVWHESSDALNNAWTWHSALCELNYTPIIDGKVDTSKPDKIIEMFEQSKQFRSYLVEQNNFPSGNKFINWVPHMSLVFGEKDVWFLKERYEKMIQNPLFSDMQYSEDHNKLKEWFPLMMKWRSKSQKIAATRSELWTDVNFGQLTRDMFNHLNTYSDVQIHTQHEITNLTQLDSSTRDLNINNLSETWNQKSKMSANFVFLWSGWMAIPLLAKSWIPQGKKYAWFPVDGQRLICNNPEIVIQHHGKVYGKAAVWAPPMSVPHLDTRIIDGKRSLLFGPYAWFTTKFLKAGHWTDMFRSINIHNIIPLIQVGLRNRPLTKYLITQVMQNKKSRMDALRQYFPEANENDRYREYAGKRVQIIKNDKEQWWILQFWTEVVVSDDKTLSALLWASPWASTSVSIILELLENSFPEKMKSKKWQNSIKEIIPSYWKSLKNNPDLATDIRNNTNKILWISKQGFMEKIKE